MPRCAEMAPAGHRVFSVSEQPAVEPLPHGAAIRTARQRAGVSLREVARRLDVSPATLSAVERGLTPLTVSRLGQIAAVLGVPAESLLARPEEEPAHTGRPTDDHHQPSEEGADRTRWREFSDLNLDPVIRSAITAFVRTGYHGATVRQIATGVGMSVPGVYHHYPSKQALLVAILDVTMDDLRWRVIAARDEGGTPSERFARMVEALALFHMLRRDLAFIGASEMRSLDEPDRTRITGLRNEVQYLLDAVIAEASRAGEFSTPYAHAAARAVSTMCTSLPTWFQTDGPSAPQDVACEYAQFALAIMRDQTSATPPTAKEGVCR